MPPRLLARPLASRPLPPGPPRPRPLPRRFYARGADQVARDLLGKTLMGDVQGVRRRARIVETEAYVGAHDLAAHSSKGRTARNEAMWGPPGHAYVYFVYGMHWMLNVVCATEGDPQAVLLRAAEPLDGWDADLSGPALLARGFGVTRALDKSDLLRGPLRIRPGPVPEAVHVDRRVGVGYAGDWAHAELRFLDAASGHVSRGLQPPRRVAPAAPGKGSGNRGKESAPEGLPPNRANPWRKVPKRARADPRADPRTGPGTGPLGTSAAGTPAPKGRHGPRRSLVVALADESCRDLPKGSPPLRDAETAALATQLPRWRMENDRLVRDLEFKDFRSALSFASAVGEVAESQGHHPDLHLTRYKRLRIESTTHSVGGLSRNDFILAAKIDRLPGAPA